MKMEMMKKRQKIRQTIKDKKHKIRELAKELKIKEQSLTYWFAGRFASERIEKFLEDRYL